jgi:LPS sulfotransferase NodH
MLHETGCAGDPLEYFNPVLLEEERRRLGLERLTYRQFLKIAQGRTTSPNGVFGIHLHSSQLANAFQTRQINRPIDGFIMGFDKYIWTRRRDRARQAVSWAVARRTQAWSSRDPKTTATADDFTPVELISALKLVCTEDFVWQGLFKDLGIAPKVIWYEDLERDYQACAPR